MQFLDEQSLVDSEDPPIVPALPHAFSPFRNLDAWGWHWALMTLQPGQVLVCRRLVCGTELRYVTSRADAAAYLWFWREGDSRVSVDVRIERRASDGVRVRVFSAAAGRDVISLRTREV